MELYKKKVLFRRKETDGEVNFDFKEEKTPDLED